MMARTWIPPFFPADPCWRLAKHVLRPLGLPARRNAGTGKLLCAQLLLRYEDATVVMQMHVLSLYLYIYINTYTYVFICIIARQGQYHRITEVVRAFWRSSEPLEAHLDMWICSSRTSGGVWPGPPGFSALVLVSHWRWALGLFLPNGYGRWRWRRVWGAHADGCLGQDGSVRPPGWCSVPEEMKAGSPRSTCCAAWAAHHQMAQCSAGLAANILSEQGNVCLSPLSFQPIKYQQQFSPPQPQPSCALSQPSLPTNLFYFSKDEKGVVYNLVSTRILTLFIFMK